MADNSSGAAFPDDDAHLDLRPLLRAGAWGAGALLAVVVAVFVGQSDAGGRRAGTALASLTGSANDQAARANQAELLARADAERDAKRLAEAVRVLTADRDRLAGRLAALERNLDDLTGSVARVAAQPRPVAEPAKVLPAEPPPLASPPQTSPPQPPQPQAAAPAPIKPAPAPAAPAPMPGVPPQSFAASGLMGPATPMWRVDSALPVIPPKEPAEAKEPDTIPLPRPGPVAMLQSYAGAGATAGPAAASVPPVTARNGARLEFAIDLGAAPTLAGVRALWDRVRVRQPAVFDGLRPLASIRDGAKPGSTELRLVAGPLADANAVARVCAALIPAGISCQPAVFDGQRLAQR